MANSVTIVIPAFNSELTLGPCLDSVVPLLASGEAEQIIVVDDGSTDSTAEVAARHPVRLVGTGHVGRSAARNLGWQTATADLVWFIDSDCVSSRKGLRYVRPHFNDPRVGAVGGSFTNACPGSWLARLIQEEFAARHRRMGLRVTFLATANVVYRRDVLEELGGFDESLADAEDADLAFRAGDADHELRFELRSKVAHRHDTRLWPYLKRQAAQGYWRVALYQRHPERATGDSYSGMIDHLQPPVALAMLVAFAFAPVAHVAGLTLPSSAHLVAIGAGLAVTLALLQAPMATRIITSTQDVSCISFVAMSWLRAVARGVGLTAGLLAHIFGQLPSPGGNVHSEPTRRPQDRSEN